MRKPRLARVIYRHPKKRETHGHCVLAGIACICTSTAAARRICLDSKSNVTAFRSA